MLNLLLALDDSTDSRIFTRRVKMHGVSVSGAVKAAEELLETLS